MQQNATAARARTPLQGSLQRSPDLLSGFKRANLWRGGGGSEKNEEEGRGQEPGKSTGQEEKGKEGDQGEGQGRGGKLEQGRRLAKAGPA